jgi:hypothetical protein
VYSVTSQKIVLFVVSYHENLEIHARTFVAIWHKYKRGVYTSAYSFFQFYDMKENILSIQDIQFLKLLGTVNLKLFIHSFIYNL